MNNQSFLQEFHHVATTGATPNNGVDRQAVTANDAEPRTWFTQWIHDGYSCTHVRDDLGKQIMDLDRQIAERAALRATVAGQYATVEAAEPRNCEAEQICSYI